MRKLEYYFLFNFIFSYLISNQLNSDDEIISDIESGRVIVKTEPEGAEIYLDNLFKGLTPKLIEGLSKGAHNLVLSLSGYEDINKIIILDNSDIFEVNEYFFAKTGNLRVLSKPIGAKIFIDDIFINYTPADIPELLVKKYFLRLELDAHDTIYDEIFIKNNSNLTKSYNLKTQLGEVRVFSIPEGLKIKINNKTYLENSPKVTNLKLKEGRYELEFLKNGYLPIKRDIFINANKKQSLNIYLKRLPTGVTKSLSSGFLMVTSEASDIWIKIKGIKGKFELPLNYYELNEGDYEIILFGKGKESQKLNIKIDRQKTTIITTKLKSKSTFFQTLFN